MVNINGDIKGISASVARGLLPLITSLEKHSEKLPEVLQQLPHLAHSWTVKQENPADAEAACSSLLLGLCRAVKSPTLGLDGRTSLSMACKELMAALIAEAQPEDTKQAPPLSKRTFAHTLLKLLSQEGGSMLPLLPADALWVFKQASAAALPPGIKGLLAGGMKAGDPAHTDHTLPLLVGLMGAAAHVVHAAHTEGVGGLGPRPSTVPTLPEEQETAGGTAVADAHVLQAAAQWACRVLRGAVQRLMGGPPSGAEVQETSQASPSAPMIRAAAHLATHACLAQLVIAPPATAGMQQVAEVLECLLDLTEAVVVSVYSVLSAEMPAHSQHATVGHVFETGASILQGVPLLMAAIVDLEHSTAGRSTPVSTLAPPTSSLSTMLSRFKGMLVSAAALASGPAGGASANAALMNGHAAGATPSPGARAAGAQANGGLLGPAASGAGSLASAFVDPLWDWDLQAPLAGSPKAGSKSPGAATARGGDYGVAAQQFVRAAAETMCVALAAVWRQDKQRALVHALLLLPGSGVASPNERKAIALVTGRLLVMLRGDEKLSQACLPLLMDAVTMQPLAGNVKVEAEADQQEAAMFACFTRTIAAMAVAAACKQVPTHDWAYEQITDLLIRLYRDHHTPGASDSAASDVRGACLVQAITRIAEGMAAGHAPRAVQTDLQVRLLSLFSDLGMRVRAGGPEVVQAMGGLLPALATAAEGVAAAAAAEQARQEQRQLKGMSQSLAHLGAGAYTSSRFSYDGFARAQKEDGARMKLLRNLWLHVALHQLATPKAPPEWRRAAGCIATHTPLLLVGLDSGTPEDVAERLKVELGPRLTRAGTAAAPPNLRASLLGTYGLASEAAATSAMAVPAEPAKRAHLLLVATCELARAALAPVPSLGERSPLATTLAYLEVSRPGSEDSAWFDLLVRRVFERVLHNVGATRAAAITSGDGPDSSSAGPVEEAEADVEARCAACVEGLAVTLIEHLSNSGGHESGLPPQVAVVSEALLHKLLTLYPHTHWNPRCMLALLGMLEAEEGDSPLGLLKPKARKGPTVIWKVLQAWVYAAALVAPTRTEAILHQFLGQTAPVAPLIAPTAATCSSALASAAALRRAADLLTTIAAARQKSGASSASGGTSDSVLALCRKQYYSGVVLGLQHMQLEDGDDCGACTVRRMPFPIAAQKVVKALETTLQDAYGPLPVVEERYMAAAALLATRSCSLRMDGSGSEDGGGGGGGGGDVSGVEHAEATAALLRSMVSVPLGRFCSEVMPLALFAWMWIAAANASYIIPLTNLAAQAWEQTVQQGLGLFSGPYAPTHGGERASEDGSACGMDGATVEGLQCHGLWLNYFDEMWDSVGDGAAATTQQASMREVIMRMLHSSLANPDALSSHPAAAGPRFRLLNLALRLARSSAALSAAASKKGADGASGAPNQDPQPTGWLLSSLLLRDRAIRAGLAWFTHPPAFSAHLTQRESQEQHATVQAFANALSHLAGNGWLQEAPRMRLNEAAELSAAMEGRSSAQSAPTSTDSGVPVHPADSEELVHPVWGKSPVTTEEAVSLLHLLCKFEMDRLQVWTHPLSTATQAQASSPPPYLPLQREWEQHARTAWRISPRLAVELAGRFPTVPTLHKEVERLVVMGSAERAVQALPQAALMLATPEAVASKSTALQHLAEWAPGKAVEGLQLISSPAGRNPLVKAYAARCLDNTPPAEVAFYLPQLVQSLRNDSNGTISAALLHKAQTSDMFAHQLIWALQTEEKPPQEAFNPEVKRSGWEPPRDFGLWGPSSLLLTQVLDAMSPAGRAYWEAENSYFEKVTGISGILKMVEKDERKAAIAVELAKFAPSRPDLYLPTNPDCRVIDHIHTSGTPMQSAAKVPILIAFKLEQLPHLVAPNPDPHHQERGVPKSLACIFKVGDDVRQDVLALQVIRLLENAFKSAGLPAYLCSYGCLPTGYERGIIEVVPNTKSRAGLGELSDKGLYDIFQTEFGMPGSPAFEAARRNFIASEAGYAIASFLLQAKDRHNGNLLISNEGHLVHIDFGFILEISPGGNMGFESAAFKLSHEMTQLLDPGANRSSATWAEFEELVLRGYLAARTVAEPIIATVALMAQSGLPCFSRGAPVENLRRRFHLEMSEKQAAAFMRQVINDAYAKWTTGFYDYIQSLQNRIPY